MAEKSGFFDAHLVNGQYDRTYLAENFARYFSSFIGNGIFGGKSNELMVRQKEVANMSVRVLSGQGWINGYWYENTDEVSLAVDVADGVLNRIDAVVLRWDNAERVIRLAVKKGTPASAPYAPTVLRNADYHELKLAEVYVKAGATSITQADITDTRLYAEECGLVAGVVQQLDMTSLGVQIDSFIENFEASNIEKMNEVLGRLNEMAEENDVASLIFDIENLGSADKDIISEATIIEQTLGYTKKNLLPYPFGSKSIETAGITFTDNGDGTITANGTANANSYFTLYRGKAFGLGNFLVNSNVDAQGKYYTYIRFVNKQTSLEITGTTKTGYDKEPIVVTGEDFNNYDLFVGFTVLRGTTVSNLVIKPMVRRAEILDDAWEPYRLSVNDMIREDPENLGCFYRPSPLTGNKEWINPPSIPGVEYRTVERWNNKSVYQMTFYVASLPVNSVMSIGTNAQWDRVISVSGYAQDSDDLTYYPFPVILGKQVTPMAMISRVESDGYIVITTNDDASYLKAYITIKYTKE